MNIFWIKAREYGYAHFKIILEIVQMLYTAHHALGSALDGAPEGAYRATHAKHPVCKWVRASGANYARACEHGARLLGEYYARYGAKRVHACEPHLRWLACNTPAALRDTCTPAHLSVPPFVGAGASWQPTSWSDLEAAYRNLYRTEKRAIALKMGKCPTGVVRAPARWLDEPLEALEPAAGTQHAAL